MQDNEDLVFSFLNSDYLAESDTSSNTVAQLHESRYFTFDDKTWDFGLDVALATQDPPSPPCSETASTDSSLLSSPKLESSDDRSKEDDRASSSSMDDVESGNQSSTLAHMDTDCWQFVSPGLVASAASKVANAITPTFEVSGSFDSLTAFTAMVPLPPALHLVSNVSLTPEQSVALQYPALPLASSSHPSSSSASSSDSEQPKRKRGRKKRDSASSVTSISPLLLKPLMPILPQTSVSASPSSTITPLLLAVTHDAQDSLMPIKSELFPPSPPLAPSMSHGKAQATANSDVIGVALSTKKRHLTASGLLSSTATSSPTVQIKSEPVQPSLATLPVLQQKTPILPAPSSMTSVAKSTSPITKSSNPQTPQDAAAAALAKRQERLIKNRAAALLSRKRKREHITLLEQHTEALALENTELKEQVEVLEDEIDQITAENCRLVEENKRITGENEELRRRVTRLEGGGSKVLDVDADRSHGHHDRMIAVGAKNSRTTGVVFMIILFSFALFSLPTGNLNRLTVGGATRPLIAPSPSLLDQPMSPLRESLLDAAPRSTPPSGGISEKDPDLYPKHELLHAPPGSAPVLSKVKPRSDLVLISNVQPKELQIWLSKSLESATATDKRAVEQTGLIYQPQPVYRQVEDSANPHAYLYCANLAHLMPNDTVRHPNADANVDDAYAWPKPLLSGRPRLSLLSPLGACNTADSTDSSNHSNPSSDKESTLAQYLQIDVEVISSHLVTANLVSLGSSVGVQSKSLFGNLDGDEVTLRAPTISRPIWKAEETDMTVLVKQERMDEEVWPLDGVNETAFVIPVGDGIVRSTKRRRVAEVGRERKMRSGRVLRPLDKA